MQKNTATAIAMLTVLLGIVQFNLLIEGLLHFINYK